MHDERPHPLLAQVPLTVSPFVTLPSAPTLPYTYKTLPSTLPPPSTGVPPSGEKSKFVISSTGGHAAHPDEIIESCRALQTHLIKLQEDASTMVREWDHAVRERELAEKRSVAPGWLDREEKLLEPERKEVGGLGGEKEKERERERERERDGSVRDPIAGGGGGGGGGGRGGMQDELRDSTGRKGRSDEGEELDRAFGGLGIR